MTKIILVPDKNNLGESFTRAGYTTYNVSLANFNTSKIISIGTPEEVPLVLLTYGSYAVVHANVCKELNRLGYVVAHVTTNGSANTSTCVLYNMGLINSVYNTRGSYSTLYLEDNNFFKKSNITVVDNVLGLTFSNSYQTTLKPESMIAGGKIIAYSDFGRTKVAACYFPSGTYVNENFTLNTPVLFLGFLYPTNIIQENGMLVDIVDFCRGSVFKPYKIEGYVKDMGKNPLQRMVRAHYHSDGSFAGETTSIEDGSYMLELLNSDPVYIVCLAENSSKSSMVHSYVVPQENIKAVE